METEEKDNILAQIEHIDALIDQYRSLNPQTDDIISRIFDLVIEKQLLQNSIADTDDIHL